MADIWCSDSLCRQVISRHDINSSDLTHSCLPKGWIFMSRTDTKSKYCWPCRDNFVYAPSQWETTLQYNFISHWLVAYIKWSLTIWVFLSNRLKINSLTDNKANLRDLIAATGLVISNWIQIVNFSARVTVKFDGRPRKTIGHLFYATSSFVHHFVPIGELKLELQSGNAQSGSNWTIFRAVRPWNLTDDLAKQ